MLKVHAENDRLKIRELEDRQKIQHLLSLSIGPSSQSTTYFVSKPPLKVLVISLDHVFKIMRFGQSGHCCFNDDK